MRGDADRQWDRLARAGCSSGFDGCSHRFAVAGDHDLPGCIDIGDDDGSVRVIAHALHRLGVKADQRSHLAVVPSACRCHRLGSHPHDGDGVLERQRARSHQRGELADAVTGDDVGKEAGRFDRALRRHRHAQDRELSDLGCGEQLRGSVRTDGVGVPSEHAARRLPGCARRPVGETLGHADELAALAGKNPRDHEIDSPLRTEVTFSNNAARRVPCDRSLPLYRGFQGGVHLYQAVVY